MLVTRGLAVTGYEFQQLCQQSRSPCAEWWNKTVHSWQPSFCSNDARHKKFLAFVSPLLLQSCTRAEFYLKQREREREREKQRKKDEVNKRDGSQLDVFAGKPFCRNWYWYTYHKRIIIDGRVFFRFNISNSSINSLQFPCFDDIKNKDILMALYNCSEFFFFTILQWVPWALQMPHQDGTEPGQEWCPFQRNRKRK